MASMTHKASCIMLLVDYVMFEIHIYVQLEERGGGKVLVLSLVVDASSKIYQFSRGSQAGNTKS